MLNNPILEIIKSRRSIRKFTGEKISDEEIICIIEAAGSAPSNSNRQPWKFIILKNEEKKKEVTQAVLNKIEFLKTTPANDEIKTVIDSYKDYLLFIKDAPVLIFALYKLPPLILSEFVRDNNLQGLESMAQNELISVSMAVENLLLASHATGLGACCTTGPLIASPEIKNILDVRPPFEIASVIALGRYDHLPDMPVRKPFKDIIEVIE
ncbi:MAG TPA: nitroreductase family protein [Ignavibacteriales bacterium]|nr:nitroreductase family protein [Ignavibacteriales bacterium]